MCRARGSTEQQLSAGGPVGALQSPSLQAREQAKQAQARREQQVGWNGASSCYTNARCSSSSSSSSSNSNSTNNSNNDNNSSIIKI